MAEVGVENFEQLLLRGGFHNSFAANDDGKSSDWRQNFDRSFLERYIPQLGIGITSVTLGRFWSKVAHYHAQVWNGSEFARSFGNLHTIIRRYVNVLEATSMLRNIKPWISSIKKRQVISPKMYFRDSGLLHTILGIETPYELERHPKMNASWEDYILENIIQALEVEKRDCYF